MDSSKFTFCPVKISRGRKFKGFAYFLYSNERPIAYGVSFDCAKLWDPEKKAYAYANADFCEEVEMPEEEVEKARLEYVNSIIDGTISWCKSKTTSDIEAAKFARNVLRKNHPEMIEWINARLPDQRDVSQEIEKTIDWALTLKSRPCVIYGKHCPGGKMYPVNKQLKIAFKSLVKKGISVLPDFDSMWELSLTVRGYAKYIEESKKIEKYVPSNNENDW